MLRERDSRVAAPDDVLATLAELDEKLAALERGMAAAQGATPGGPDRDGRPPAGGVELPHEHVVADFQAAARSRTERRLWRQAIPEASNYPAPDPAEPAGELTAPLVEAGGPPAAAEVEAAARSWPPHAAPATVVPEPAPAAAIESLGIAVAAAELAGWRERLRRAIDELTALQAEIETAAVRVGAAIEPAAVAASGVQPAPPSWPVSTPPAPGPPPPTRHPGAGDVPAGSGQPAGGVKLPVPMPHDRIFQGVVRVDAGPFLDIGAVTAFQRALELVPGARAVDVTALDLDRAHLELELSDPVALGREIRAVFPFHFAIFEAGHGRLSINVDAASLSAPQRASAPR
jgi:hypothetical protein